MNWKVVLTLLTCNVVLMSASYTMLIPFLPIYLKIELNTPDESLNLWSGAIFAITFAVSAFMSPIWGKLADKKGKKIMLLRSALLIALTYGLGSIVTTPLELFLVRVLQGFAAGMWPASLALMSAYSPKSKIGFSMGIMQSANICGTILGPLLGGLLAQYFGMRSTFVISCVLILIISILTMIFIKEPPKAADTTHNNAHGGTFAMLKNKSILLILIAGGMTQMVILFVQPVMTLYISQLAQDDSNILVLSGLVFSLSGIAGAIAAPIWGRTGQNIGFYKTIVAALVSAGIVISLQSFPSSLLPFAIMQFFAGLCFSGIFPSANSMLVNHTPSNLRGTAFGLFFSAQQVGGAIGPLIGGLVATLMDLSLIFLLSGLTLLFLGIYFMKAAPIVLRYNRVDDIDETLLDGNKELQKECLQNDPNLYVEKIKAQIIQEMKDLKARNEAMLKDSQSVKTKMEDLKDKE